MVRRGISRFITINTAIITWVVLVIGMAGSQF